MVTLPPSLLDAVHARLITGLGEHASTPEIAERVIRYLRNTAETTVSVEQDPDGTTTTFVITGDIPAMWLRDSAAQLQPLLRLVEAGVGTDAERVELIALLVGLLRRHWRYIERDPYANAFNRTDDGSAWDDDDTDAPTPWAWERKFELDSLSYGPDLAWRLWRRTGTTAWADAHFVAAARRILETVATEQDHEARSPYFFRRSDCPPSDTLVRDGRGREVRPSGLVWSGFRPSDDACELGYNVPGNHYLALALDRLGDLLDATSGPVTGEDLSTDAGTARALAASIREGLREHGTMRLEDGTEVWAYEVDGAGAAIFLDDANVPSLLSLPHLGCVGADDPLYRATRAAVLSDANPYHYRGTHLAGVGSPHTPPRHVWPIALSVQGLTSTDAAEKRSLLETLMATDGGTGMMHEGVDVDDPTRFTREWFSWSNAMFCELALDLAGVRDL
ncbi:glycoside hydrolase family 125 protein [Brachybacterium sp. AOP25-B2-12]|uniref:glycoside hydrolase family 125 protein n=1 Tax=Brachybacterium sp. AOP25-B2-12 TaxID=3457710 RepID=UPI004033FB4C